MSQGIRFIWDFFGPNAEKTAAHHHKHLAEFLKRHGQELRSGTYQVGEGHFSAFIETPDRPIALSRERGADGSEGIADQIGRALRPNRLEELDGSGT